MSEPATPSATRLRRTPLAIAFAWTTLVGFVCGWYAAQPDAPAQAATAPVSPVAPAAPVGTPSPADAAHLGQLTALPTTAPAADSPAPRDPFSRPELRVTYGFVENGGQP